MSLISIIIKDSPEAILTRELCQNDLSGIDYEILIVDNWQEGLDKSRGSYVMFLEEDCVFTPGYFLSLLDLFENKPLFRKLAMVAPAVGVNSWDKLMYGYRVTSAYAVPTDYKVSSQPYLTQAAYIPGALIRKTKDLKVVPDRTDIVNESVRLSLSFWDSGNRVIVNPNAVYVSTKEDLYLPSPVRLTLKDSTVRTFEREMI